MADKCQCDFCLLARRIEAEKPRMTEETVAIITKLWVIAEHASAEAEWIKMNGDTPHIVKGK